MWGIKNGRSLGNTQTAPVFRLQDYPAGNIQLLVDYVIWIRVAISGFAHALKNAPQDIQYPERRNRQDAKILSVGLIFYNFLQFSNMLPGSLAQGILLQRTVMTMFSQPAFALIAITC